MVKKESAEKAVRDIRRKARRRFSAEEKIRIVIEAREVRRASPRCIAAKASWRILAREFPRIQRSVPTPTWIRNAR